MFGRRKDHVLVAILCLTIVTAHSGESSEGICSEPRLIKRFFAQMTSKCYHVSMPSAHSDWGLCNSEEVLNCDSLKKYVTVIPSCSRCNTLTGDMQEYCFRRQYEAVNCTIDQWLMPTLIKAFTCVKDKGKCELRRRPIFTESSTRTTTTSGTAPSFATKPSITPSTEQGDTQSTAGVLGSEGFHRGCRKCKTCEECTPCDQSACMSVGGAVGLFFLGVFIGALVTCALCLFVPAFHRKSSSILHNKVMKKSRCPTTSNDTNPSNRQAIGISNIQYNGDRVLPSAPEDTYNDLSHQGTADSHTYSGLQSPTSESAVYSDPAASDTYDAPHDRVSHQSSISSPTYHIPQDGVISGTTNRNTEQPTWRSNNSSNRVGDDSYDHTGRPIRNNDTHPTGNTYNALQNYNTNNQNMSDNSRNQNPNGNPEEPATSDHQYFVLEPHNDDTVLPQTHHQSPNRDSTYSPGHSYFVLEKQS